MHGFFVSFALGNFFAMRCEHEKAVVAFQRAVRLDRSFGAAWMLMGHEYVELRNIPAAVEAYRRASGTWCASMRGVVCCRWLLHHLIPPNNSDLSVFAEANQNDFRAWYALGQAYELLRLFDFALIYYTKAVKLRPTDSRMLVADRNMQE